MVAHNGTAAELTGRLRMALAIPAAPNPLPGRWFGCPGAGPIRACHTVGLPTTVLMSQCPLPNPIRRERGLENGYPDRLPCQRFSEHLNGHQPGGLEREDVALAGGVVRVLRPTPAGACLWLVDATASTPCLTGCRVGHREWGLRPQTPPPTEMSMVAHHVTAAALTSRLRVAFAVPAPPNPLPGWWFGCPGAGPIRAWCRVGGPTTVLMS